MRKSVSWILAGALSLAPVAAHAKGTSVGGCLAGPMPNDLLSRCTLTGTPAVALGAIAAPMVLAGAVVTLVDELNRHPHEVGDLGNTAAPPPGASPRSANLSLLPATRDRYREEGTATGRERRGQPAPNGALQFNETATTVAAAVTGVAVVGAIIATLASKK